MIGVRSQEQETATAGTAVGRIIAPGDDRSLCMFAATMTATEWSLIDSQ